MAEIRPGVTYVEKICNGVRTITVSSFNVEREGDGQHPEAVATMLIPDNRNKVAHIGVHRLTYATGADNDHCSVVYGPCSYSKDVLPIEHLPSTTEGLQQLLYSRLNS